LLIIPTDRLWAHRNQRRKLCDKRIASRIAINEELEDCGLYGRGVSRRLCGNGHAFPVRKLFRGAALGSLPGCFGSETEAAQISSGQHPVPYRKPDPEGRKNDFEAGGCVALSR